MTKIAKKDPNRNAPEEVDQYLAGLPQETRDVLNRVRDIILTLVPDATQRVSYGVPIIRLKRDLVGFAAQKKHCSLYMMSSHVAEKMREELSEYKRSGTTLHFQPDTPLPVALIQEIIKARLEEMPG